MRSLDDPTSAWNHDMTSFFAVQLVLTVVSLTLGTIIGVFGIRALSKMRSSGQSTGGGQTLIASSRCHLAEPCAASGVPIRD